MLADHGTRLVARAPNRSGRRGNVPLDALVPTSLRAGPPIGVPGDQIEESGQPPDQRQQHGEHR
jgi:hypothetical protein